MQDFSVFIYQIKLFSFSAYCTILFYALCTIMPKKEKANHSPLTKGTEIGILNTVMCIFMPCSILPVQSMVTAYNENAVIELTKQGEIL